MGTDPHPLARPVRVAVVDSGIDAGALGIGASEVTAMRFAAAVHETDRAAGMADTLAPGEAVRLMPPGPDRLGHGTEVARLILAAAPEAALISAQVFADGRPVAASAVVAAIDWAVAQGAELINLSLGLREDHWVLRQACASARAAGVLLVASAPARGGAVYPAAYPGVIAATGDARCAEGEWSLLECGAADDAPGSLALTGAAPLPLPPTAATRRASLPNAGGASYAAARVCGVAARWRQHQPAVMASSALAAHFIEHLAAGAAYRGRERHLPEHAA